jgi:ABC-type glutathione transport system ATPase component
MQGFDILRECHIVKTPRLMQMQGIFDVAPSERSAEKWHVDLTLPDQWNVGLIVGPSGSGKTTVARELFDEHIAGVWGWPDDKSILDGFPADMSIKEIVELLSSVGFSSPPSWVRPFHVLSNGEQFRVNMARTLAEM